MWTIENFTEGDIVIEADEVENKTTVKIFDCSNCTVTVHGKCNLVSLDGCKKVSVQVDAVITGVEVSKCNTTKIYGIEKLPFVNVE